jgi:hypothetical protein
MRQEIEAFVWKQDCPEPRDKNAARLQATNMRFADTN